MMEITYLNPDSVAVPALPFSNVVVAGDFCFVSGQAALEKETGALIQGDFATEARLVFQNLQNNLAAVGLTLRDVVKVNAYLGDTGYIKEYNAIYREFISAPYPARTTIGCMMGGIRLEIDCIAYLKGQAGQ